MEQNVFRKRITETVRDNIRDLFYKRQGLKTLVESNPNPTEAAIIKLGKATSEWEEAGVQAAQEITEKLIANNIITPDRTIVQWTCDFDNCEMEITLN